MRFRYEVILKEGNERLSKVKLLRKFIQKHLTIFIVVFATVIISLALYLGGVFALPLEDDFENFTYPLDIPDFKGFVQQIDSNHKAGEDLNYKSIAKTLKQINYTNQSIINSSTLEQFDNLDYTIDIKTSCADQWKRNDEHERRLITVIIIVKSAANNYARRRAIRATWYENRTDDIFQFKTVFMVGACNKINPVPKSLLKQNNGSWTPEDCRGAIKQESLLHGDLIQSSGVDSYYNNTIKTVMTLRWVTNRCKSDFFLSIDDDFVFEAGNFKGFLKDIAIEHSPSNYSAPSSSDLKSGVHSIVTLKQLAERHLYAGYVRDYVHPHRHVTSKWCISRHDYPFNKYPRFVTGGAILMSHKTVRHFSLATYFTKSFKFDDVYVGIMAQKLDMYALNEENFMCDIKEYLAIKSAGVNATTCIGVHDISPDDLEKLWLDQSQTNSTKPT